MLSRKEARGVAVGLFLAVCLSALCFFPFEVEAASLDPVLATQILETFVNEEGWVDYAGLKKQGGEPMEKLLRALAQEAPEPADVKEKMAFYINAYNLFTLKLIADHYPVESIRKIPGVSGVAGIGQWKKKLWVLNGGEVSLDEIEHERLRPLGDPRIHFALVCAARSCPPLARKAYTAGNLDHMLEEQGRRFNRLPRGLQTATEKGWTRERPVLKLSKIYDWFTKDFLRVSPDLPAYVLPFAGEADRVFIEKNRDELKVRYLEYDWTLNDQH